MALDTKKSTGNWGEDRAAQFLYDKGHRQIVRNWRRGYLEVDLFSVCEKRLHVTEVKTRLEGVLGNPSDWLSARQQQRLVEAAHFYIQYVQWEGETQFDVLAITHKNPLVFNYIPNAFYP